MVMLDADCEPSNSVVVFTTPAWAAFSVMQASPQEIWRREFSSTFEDRLKYVPSDGFDSFPFPEMWAEDRLVGEAGQEYHVARAGVMLATGEGLTDTYNRFHDPYEHDPKIERLRELHTVMDRAVLRAYGWDDIPTNTEFLLDYEIDEEEWGNRKKPYRLRWPDPVRDEVLARLIALNGERAAEEALSGAAADPAKKQGRRAPRKQAAAGVQELG